MVKHYKNHCRHVPNESRQSMVMIDGGFFKFYISKEKDGLLSQKNLQFDKIIMNPLIKKCITTDGHTLKSITSACQF
jgi:hypothetical protein